MSFKTIALITNTDKVVAASETPKVIKWLQDKGIVVKLAQETVSELKCGGNACTKEQLIDGTDLIITMGGDGTVLKAVSFLQGKPTPILAINYGKFGFLLDVEPADLYTALESVIMGDFHIEQRNLLEIEFEGQKFQALNDLVVSHDGFRIMEIETYINGTYFYTYAADGLAVATATGAAAYSFSAGGPFVNPRISANVLTPLNPHSLLNRSIVLGADDVIKLRIAGIDGNLKIAGDGIIIYHGQPVEMQATGSNKTVHLVKLKPTDFFGFLRKKLVTLCGVNGAK